MSNERASDNAPSPATEASEGMNQQELEQQTAENMPDREAMSLLGGTLGEPVLGPVTGLIQGSILDQVSAQLPPEAAGIDLGAVANSALTDGDPLGALPPELVPDTTQVTETQAISDQTAA